MCFQTLHLKKYVFGTESAFFNILETNPKAYLVAGAGAGDTEGHGGTVANMGVVGFRQQLYHSCTKEYFGLIIIPNKVIIFTDILSFQQLED